MWQQKQLFESVLKNEKIWEQYIFMFKICSFKIYESIKVTYFTKKLEKKIETSAK